MTMVMSDDQVISASYLKARCLALLDDVAATGRSIVVTKRGKPVARLAPIDGPRSLRGTVKYLVDDEELLAPIDVTWDAHGA
jgi:prevent-host-death family protein